MGISQEFWRWKKENPRKELFIQRFSNSHNSSDWNISSFNRLSIAFGRTSTLNKTFLFQLEQEAVVVGTSGSALFRKSKSLEKGFIGPS